MREFIGYHGTTKENGTSILKTKRFKPSGAFRDWLGRGVYFFEGDRHQAYMYIKYKEGKEHVLPHNEICVLSSKVIVEQSKMLDLLTDDDRKFLYDYGVEIKKRVEEMQKKTGRWKHKEGFVIDNMIEDFDGGIDLVRAVYQVPQKNLKYRCFDFLNIHVQLCVKNLECIVMGDTKEVNCDAYRGNEEKSA